MSELHIDLSFLMEEQRWCIAFSVGDEVVAFQLKPRNPTANTILQESQIEKLKTLIDKANYEQTE